MLFEVLARAFDNAEHTTSRTQLTSILVDLFKKSEPEIVDKVVYLIQGRLWPDWAGLPELGVGVKILIKAMSKLFNTREDDLEALYSKLGDSGKVAEHLKSSRVQAMGGLTRFVQKAEVSKLTVTEVYDTLTKVALAVGEGSRDIKINLVVSLLSRATPLEARYIARLFEGRLRLGIGDATIMDALSIVYTGSALNRQIVEYAYNVRADLGNVAKILATRGLEALREISPTPGTPIRPMLAERLSDPQEILSKTGGQALVEFKYDGERAQIHKTGDKVVIFSRRLENITHQYPDVVEMTRSGIKVNEAIVEGEIVCIDPDTGSMRPFQELMHRKRKHDIHEAVKEYPVAVYLFDALYIDGTNLINKPIRERREFLSKIVSESEKFRLSESMLTSNASDLEKFFLKAVEDGAEGVMVKAVHSQSIYQAGARGWLWIKYKRDYRSEMIDTVDLVVVGAFRGRGRRGGKIGALLVAAYDEKSDTFQTVCKVGSGFSDEDLARLDELLSSYTINHRHPRVISDMEPDIWVVPALVVEILGAELTLSPQHTCCRGVIKKGVGISIRFPRFIRWRDDKGPEDATRTSELVNMYLDQLKKIAEEPVEKVET
ncbi:MAG: ATP-dependent DNA ligase [Sulfolobales archaeon]|nr:ATP-dependent DNA ligase [Sulfolobales archaeon]MDW8083352.1 ATP-dependent DNA ligase [Sulfolobales archaeon]